MTFGFLQHSLSRCWPDIGVLVCVCDEGRNYALVTMDIISQLCILDYSALVWHDGVTFLAQSVVCVGVIPKFSVG